MISVLLPPKNSYGKEHFCYWENFLSDDEINYLLNHPNWANVAQACVGKSENGPRVELGVRDSKVSWFLPDDQNMVIWKKLTEVVTEVNRRFFKFDLTGIYEPAQMGLYTAKTNSHYDWHIDSDVSDNGAPRKLSMALMLSDPSEFSGGELQLKATNDKEISVEQKQGRAWFFPSYMIHRVSPVMVGVRKSLVMWVGGPEFK